jgi:hypothetical protein
MATQTGGADGDFDPSVKELAERLGVAPEVLMKEAAEVFRSTPPAAAWPLHMLATGGGKSFGFANASLPGILLSSLTYKRPLAESLAEDLPLTPQQPPAADLEPVLETGATINESLADEIVHRQENARQGLWKWLLGVLIGCIALLIVPLWRLPPNEGADMALNLIQIILPLVTLSVGFYFGKGNS